MEEKIQDGALCSLKKSKFVRTVFLRIILIILIVIIAVIAIVFFFFTSEIRNSILSERQKQLDVINDTISERMEAATSIAYNIGTDESFYLESVEKEKYSGTVMSKTLERYLVGNDFIEHLAYYRISDPDVLYTSKGEISFIDFLCSFMRFDQTTAQTCIDEIQSTNKVVVKSFLSEKAERHYFTYLCPLPQFSKNPQAFVIMLIPEHVLSDVLETQLMHYTGEVLIYNALGEELYKISNLTKDIPLSLSELNASETLVIDGSRYMIQKSVSDSNGWTYVSIIRMSDIISGVAQKQIIFIVLLLILMSVAIFTLLMSIVKQYSPINSLAREMKTQIGASTDGSLIDEKSLLTDSFAVLKGDSELKQRFEAAYHEADAANKAKSAFLSNMSHDIRTPMNAIVGMTELAAKHTNDPTYVKECLQSVSVASQYLLDIINNVLDMSRIESGQFSLSEDEIDLVKLVHGMMTILNHNIEVKSQKLIVTVDDVEDEHMIGDNIRLTQVLMNILSNAVKFTPNGGTIRLQIRQKKSLEPEYGEYEFVISDTGIGMTKEFVQKVFDTFTRDENVGISRIEGTGLGMAIAKNLIDLMGGTINCESELGQGTTFTVTIRMKLTNTQAADTQKTDGKIAAELSNKEMSENIQVLILGNEAEECENQVIQFKRAGASAEYAQSVTAALTMIQKKKEMQSIYDFVIINQTEHDQSGIIAVSQMSKELPISQTTYVFAAGDTFSVENSKAFNAGISIFVQRPLFKSTVTGIINRTIQLADHLQETNIVNLEGKNILLVEDNEINRQIAAAILSETHADIYEATNGKEAVEAFKSHESGFFDMILMDVQMPKMNGYDATIAIRSIQREDALSVPIYAMTANTYDEDVRQVKAVGMDGHIGKPYSSNDLYAILKQAILPEVKP